MNGTDYLRELIHSQGPIDLSQFMSIALLHPQYGYYQQETVFGRDGDFITAPEISQVFGELIGIWCAAYWLENYKNTPIALVELGPGKGTLMHDLLNGTKHITGFHEHCEIHLVETSQKLRAHQHERLSAFNMSVKWHDSVETLPKKTIIVIANEFFDALPIHQYHLKNNQWYETMVTLHEGQLTLTHHAAPIAHALKTHYPDCPEGGYVERSPASEHIMQVLSDHIAQHGGASLIIDYGYDELNYRNSFQAVKNHHYHNPLESIGEADLTAHVDFQQLLLSAQQHSLHTLPILTQQRFLEIMGIHTRTQQLTAHASETQRNLLESASHRLTDGDAMGTLFKVLLCTHAQTKNPIGTA